jgi:HAD superfamily hydrolase (TIGR01484 family)
MTNFKLLILDLDGTTVEPSGDALPSQKVINAVQQAQEVLHVAVATGRPYPYAKNVMEALSLKGLGVVNGGAEIVDMRSGEVIYSKKIDANLLKELVTICLPFNCNMFTDETEFSVPIASVNDIQESAGKLYIDAVESSVAIKILEELEAVEGVSAHPTKSWTKGDVVDIHVTHEHATKRYGVEWLISMLNLNKDEVMAIGDDHNDVPLMMAAGFKVAMGDAPTQVKNIADHITGDLENDGVASAIEDLILLGLQ